MVRKYHNHTLQTNPRPMWNMWTQRRDNLWPHGHNLNKKEKYLLDNPTQNIKAISLVVSDKKIFKVFENLFLPMWSRYTISSIIWEGHISTISVSQIWLNSSHYFRVRYRLKQLLMTHDGQQTSNDHNSSLWAYDSGGLIKYTKYWDFKHVYSTLTLDNFNSDIQRV